MSAASKPPEIIAIASGKGGTGKTLLGACLGYALTRARHRVLMVDADPGTDGLSLFLLGPKGMHQIGAFQASNTFRGLLGEFGRSGRLHPEPRRIERTAPGDQGVAYTALISGKGLYGDGASDSSEPVVPDLDQGTFRRAITALFAELRSSGEFDYVIVDTRGGFALESTDVCAAADSLIMVTDADYTSFHQNRNLVTRISAAAAAMGTKTLLRAILVNRAVDGDERSFRLELEKEFPIRFIDTFAIPLDVEALKAYRQQQMPYIAAPASPFAYATLSAFSDMLQIVTAQWPRESIDGWNGLVQEVANAIERRNAELELEERKRAARAEEMAKLRGRSGLPARYRWLLGGVVTVLLAALVAVAVLALGKSRLTGTDYAVEVTKDPQSNVAVQLDVVDDPVAEQPLPAPDAGALAPAVTVLPPSTVAPAVRPVAPPRAPASVQPPVESPPIDLARYLTPRGSYKTLAGMTTGSGKQVFRYTVWLDLDASLVERVVSVRYRFNHSSFVNDTFTSTASPRFEVSYEGWGCVNSVTATLVFSSGPPASLEFSQCAAIRGTKPSAKAVAF